jgi:glycosyltransferase 2 family protein
VTDAAPPARAGGARWRIAAGWLVAAVALAWVFHDVRLADLRSAARPLRWDLVALAVACDIASYACQGLRWSLLLRPVGRLPVTRTTQAIYIGLFTNEILPLRAGEVVRAFLAARRLGTGAGAVLPSMVVERLFDGVWTALAIGVTAIFVPLPPDLVKGEEVLGAAVAVGALVFLYLVINRARHGEMHGRLGRLAAGIGAIGVTPGVAGAFIASGLVLLLQILAFWLVMRAAGLALSPWAGAAVLLVVHLGTALPNAPSNVGTYQFFTVVGLALFGVGKAVATGFSVIVFLILTIPLWLLGMLALGTTGMSLGRIRREALRPPARE